ncbi:hypothetical protein [Larkinella ripae]
MDHYYRQLAVGHQTFEITNGSRLEEGSSIHCEETAGNQQVIHRYKVERLVSNQSLYYVSKPSVSYINGNKHRPFKSNTHVQYTLAAVSANQTALTTTVIIQFPSSFAKLLAILSGTRKLWQAHVVEETTGLKRVIESLVVSERLTPASADTP